MLKKLCLTIASVSCLLLTGCLTTSSLTAVNYWQGRFSVIAQSADHKENHSGRFSLTTTNNASQVLDLKTALGNTLARIEYARDSISVQAVGIEETVGKDSNALMSDLLGFSVPIDGLAFWIDGQVLPNTVYESEPNTAPYQHIRQLGWDITYRQYDDSGLPRRIVFERQATTSSPALKITLIILERRHGTP